MTDVSIFEANEYVIRRKVFKLLGGAFHVYDGQGRLLGYSRQKAFKLKEDIRVFSDESCSREMLAILARNVIDFSASYDVVDATSSQPVGTLRRRGLKSMIRDEWTLLNPDGEQIGLIKEDTAALALIRRFMTNLIPQSYTAKANDVPVADFRQNFNPFVHKLRVNVHPSSENLCDRRLLLAAGILLTAIEGRQQ